MAEKNRGKTNPKLVQNNKNSRVRSNHNFLDFVNIAKGAQSILLMLPPLLLILVSYGIFRGLYSRYFMQDADSASFFDFLSTSGDGRNSSGAYGNSFWDLYTLVETGDLSTLEMKTLEDSSIDEPLGSHAYLLSQVIHKVNLWPLDATWFPHAILTLSYALGLTYIIFYFSKVKPINPISLSILMAMIVLSPAFYLSLQGQNYMDRLFFAPGIYVVLNLLNQARSKSQNAALITTSLFSFMISERVSLILGAAIIFTFFWKVNNWKKIDYALLALGSTGVCWYFYWSSTISVSKYTSNTSLEVMQNNFLEAINGTRTIALSSFFLGNAVLLVLSTFNKRAVSLALISMLPNIFVSVGGAELTGFLTHYHSIYLPILVASAAVGYSGMRTYQLKTKTFLPVVSLIIILALCSQLISTAPKEGRSRNERALYSLGKVGDSFGISKTDIVDSRESTKEGLFKLTRRVDSDGITTPPELMPTLAYFGFSQLRYFPIGIGNSKYVIASYLDSKMDYPRESAFGMVSEERINQWGPELQRILTSSYQKIEQISLGNRTYILYKKIS